MNRLEYDPNATKKWIAWCGVGVVGAVGVVGLVTDGFKRGHKDGMYINCCQINATQTCKDLQIKHQIKNLTNFCAHYDPNEKLEIMLAELGVSVLLAAVVVVAVAKIFQFEQVTTCVERCRRRKSYQSIDEENGRL